MAESEAEQQNYDLSARGVSIIVTPNGGTAIELTDFPDDLDPFTVDEADFAEVKMDANGEWYRQSSYKPIGLHISLIPGSKAEKDMDGQIKSDMFGNSNCTYEIQVNYTTEDGGSPLFKQKTFKGGWMTGCSLGYSATSQGRVRTKQYTFKFPMKEPQ